MSQPQRKPVLYKPNEARDVEIVQESGRTDRIINLGEEVKEIQSASTIPMGSYFRRWIFVWLRVFVIESKRGKQERVNIKIPIPIPIIGAAFSRQLSFQKAAKVAAQVRRGEDVSDVLDSTMGFEFIRVEDDHPERGKSTLVVIGLD
jgi:hypothetical protein